MKKNEIQKESTKDISNTSKYKVKKTITKRIHINNIRRFMKINMETLQIYLKSFHCILNLFFRYKPKIINIETPLKPFIPDYIPQVSFPDPMLKVPRPDGK